MMRFLFVDRILELEERKRVKGIKHVTVDDPLSSSPDSPDFFIPSLIGETLGQLAAWNVMKTQDFKARPVAGILSQATFYRPAFVGETIAFEAFIDHLDEAAVEYHGVARIDDEVIFTMNGALGPMLPMDTFIDESTVKQQFDAIFRPTTHIDSANVSAAWQRPSLRGVFEFDQILALEPGKHIQAKKHISSTAPYFPDHFPKHPVLPLTVLLECKHHLAKTFLSASNLHGYRLSELQKIKMKAFVHPGQSITSKLSLIQQTSDALVLKVVTEQDGKRICTADMTFIPESTPPCNQDA